MAQDSHPNIHHGNTPAAWTASIIVLVAFVIGALAVVWENWPLFWIGGVALAAIGGIVGKVMQMMGLGQPLPTEQETALEPTGMDPAG